MYFGGYFKLLVISFEKAGINKLDETIIVQFHKPDM